MIYVFRGLLIFSVLNLLILFIFDGGAGMEPVWVFLIFGSLLLSFTSLYQLFFSIRWIKMLFVLVVTLFVIVEALIILSGFKTSIAVQSQYIIILGARVKDETPSLALKYRLDKAYTYLNKNPQTIAILSGGQGPGESITEAEAMRRYLSQKGIAKERLVLEEHSTNTYENI
ncbi:MAG: YdcF family protein, partial [Clostridia bacterium]|nr:YdcF family protein [Clostridia bacterium]